MQGSQLLRDHASQLLTEGRERKSSLRYQKHKGKLTSKALNLSRDTSLMRGTYSGGCSLGTIHIRWRLASFTLRRLEFSRHQTTAQGDSYQILKSDSISLSLYRIEVIGYMERLCFVFNILPCSSRDSAVGEKTWRLHELGVCLRVYCKLSQEQRASKDVSATSVASLRGCYGPVGVT